MTTGGKPCDDIARDAVGLLALPAEAPERAAAEAHARTCADCARVLAEARGVLALLGRAEPPEPSPRALERVASAVRAASDREAAARTALATFFAVVAAWLVPLALFRAPIQNDTSLGYVLIMLAVAAAGATSFVGRRAAAAFPALSAMAALVAGRGSALVPRVGVHCATIEIATALAAAAATWALTKGMARQRRDPQLLPSDRPVPLALAAVGGGALAGHAALHVGCAASSELPHLLVFHTGPVLFVVALASLLDRRRKAEA